MAKVELAITTHSSAEVASIMHDYSTSPLKSSTQLFGGYSGANYRVELEDDSTFVLKVTNGYNAQDVELMCRTADYLGKAGYSECTLPVPLRVSGGNYEFASVREGSGIPSSLQTFVCGRPADKVMRESPELSETVMRGIGGGLARMHVSLEDSVGLDETRRTLRWYDRDGGCCDVWQQMNGEVLRKIEGCGHEDVIKHEFLRFYVAELALLQAEMKLACDGKLALGICHGDAFSDNVLVDEDTGELGGFVDLEDVCIGPLLFDIACCAIGCCFTEIAHKEEEFVARQTLDFRVFGALLHGYSADRRLPPIEREHFVPFMRLALLCNCTWRFVKFNVTCRNVPKEARDSYYELQQRIEYLNDPHIESRIKEIIGNYC